MKKNKGFTLIELLIVIAVLGILIVAILSAINPLEQIRKARDAGRKSDAAELLSAYERYFATFECYPWNATASGPCTAAAVVVRTPASNPVLTDVVLDSDLVVQGELKSQYANRDSVNDSLMWVSETAVGNVSVCYEPESASGRQGGYGTLMDDNTNDTDGLGTHACATETYGTTGGTTCWVCVPQ